MSFTKSVYHIVFSTKHRFPSILVDKERILYKILLDLMRKYGAFVYRIGGMPDHIHILVDITSKNSLQDFVKLLKQESSYLAARNDAFPNWCGWEQGYAAFTYSVREIPTVTEYINNQKEHHRVVTFAEEYRNWLIDMGVSPDEPYFPK